MFDGIYARGGAAAQLTPVAWLQAMLDVEAALARVQAAAGAIPADAARAIVEACDASRFDVAPLTAEASAHATPVVGLVCALRVAVGPDAAPHVHAGATSQDVVDTAAMLVARRALAPILADAGSAAAGAATLAHAHRATAMAGRTLLQQALPTSFGLRAAQWLAGIDRARRDLALVRDAVLAAQLAGPVGHGPPAPAAALAADLGLADPGLPWHTERTRVVRLAGALGALCGAFAKVARDVTLLGQDELGEVREDAAGRSSAMGHKRNPVAAVCLTACWMRVPGLVGTLTATMAQEHERAAGAWQAEWGTLGELLSLTGSIAAWGRHLLDHLEVRPERMAENLVRLAAAGVAEAQDPHRHLGASGELIDRALALHRA